MTDTFTNPDDLVQQAVENFVDRCTAGEPPDPEVFAKTLPESVRQRVLQRCIQYLQFDDFVGHQSWSTDDFEQPEGRLFGDFVIQEELGRGGMGIVYLAHQRSLNRRVAVKVLASGLTLSKPHVERFRREAMQAAQLHHPGIVPVHSFTEIDGTFAFAMDYIAGRNLGEVIDDLRLANGPDPEQIEGPIGLQPDKSYVAESALLCAQIAGALAAAHTTGIAHRDIKPRNIMIDDCRRALLLDFGLAKSIDQAGISRSGEITGTPHYMSPEQTLAKRVPLDHRTDIFSLGIILYELLTLRRPFDGKNLQQVVYEICFKEPRAIQRLNPKVPRDLVTVCNKALEKDPVKRYQTAAEFEADLVRFLRWEPIHARPAGPLVRMSKWVQRHRTETGAMLVLVLVGVIAWGVDWFRVMEAQATSGNLLRRAHLAADANDYQRAIQLTTDALKLTPNSNVEAKLALFVQGSELKATQEQRTRAEAGLLLMKSSQFLERDRELALQAALKAVDKLDTPAARNAVLTALGSGYRTRTFAATESPIMSRLDTAGNIVATILMGRQTVLWDAKTGEALHHLEGHGAATDLAFHPDGKRIATANAKSSAVLWSLDTGAELTGFELGDCFLSQPDIERPVKCTVEMVQFDRQGQRLLTVAWADYQHGPYLAQVWDVDTGQPLGAMHDHERYIQVAAISPCGRYVASYGDLGLVRLWDAATGAAIAALRHPPSRVRDLEFSPDSGLLATACSDDAARVFAVPSGELLRTARHSGDVVSVEFDATGRRLLTGSRDYTARLWDLSPPADPNGTSKFTNWAHATAEAGPNEAIELRTFLGHSLRVNDAHFDPLDQYVITACGDDTARIFDASSGALLMHYEVGAEVLDARFDSSSSTVLIQGGSRRAVLWHLDETGGTVSLRHRSFVGAAGFDNEGKLAVTASDDESVSIWNSRDGRLVSRITGIGDPISAVDLDPKSRRLLVATISGTVTFYGLWNGEKLQELTRHRGVVNTAAFTLDGERIVTCAEDGRVIVWNARDSRPLCDIQLDGPAAAAALSVDGVLLAAVKEGAAKAHLWDVTSGASYGVVGGHRGPIRAVTFTPNGEQILTASQDGTARLMTIDGALIREFQAGVALDLAAFDGGGHALLTCSSANRPVAHLWNVQTGELRLRFTGHSRTIQAAALSRDGAWAITGSKDRTASIWPTDPVTLARSLELRELSNHEISWLGVPESLAPEPEVPNPQEPDRPLKAR